MGCCSLLTRNIELLKDPSFKRYAAVVDRALTAFDTIVEWPDYIAFLGRLLKVIGEFHDRLTYAGLASISNLSSNSI